MSIDFKKSVVSVLDAKRKVVGTGFVVSADGLIATCAHVIDVADESVQLVFYDPEIPRERREVRAAKIARDYLREAEDIALLRLEGPLPRLCVPLPLGSSYNTAGEIFLSFGFPEAKPGDGMLGECKVVGPVASEDGISLLQLTSNEVSKGFSGGPVWDKERQVVIGMVNSIVGMRVVKVAGVELLRPFDPGGRQTETAFATPMETLLEVCPLLRTSEECPYRGLDAFTEGDQKFFFGRERVIDNMVDHLRKEPRFLAVLGPSGCGKSSLIQAGLIPFLRRGAILGSDRWKIIVTRPTNPSFTQLVISMQQSEHDVALIIDQFEELFVAFSTEACKTNLNLLENLLNSSSPIHLILTMRDEFYSSFVQKEKLVQWLNQGLYNVPSLQLDELIAIVEKPAKVSGLRFEHGLVKAIVEDAIETSYLPGEQEHVGRSSILPLLEFTLTQLWGRREKGVLTYTVYENIGRVPGGLTQWANKTFFALEERQRPIAKRIFTDLIHLGNKEQNIPDTRRRRLLTTLYRSESESESVSQVIQRLTNARLLVTSLEGQEETVEIIHDALLREWNQLRGWIEEDRKFLAWRQGLEPRVGAWINTNPTNAKKRDDDSLLRGNELVEATSWLSDRKVELKEDERAFIRVSTAKQRRSEMLRRATFSAIIIILIAALISAYFLVAAQNSLLNSLPVSVTNLNDHGPGSLREAIATASSGGAITFLKTLKGVIKLTGGELAITKNITITGPGADILSISGENRSRVFRVSNGSVVTISRLSIIRGNAPRPNSSILFYGGGGIYNDGNLVLNDVTVSNSKVVILKDTINPALGGGIYNQGVLTLSESNISNNMAEVGGGIYNNTGTLTILTSTISGNIADEDGGGISNNGTTDIRQSTFIENRAKLFGGGIDSGANLFITNCTLSDNRATKGGGVRLGTGRYSGITYSTITRNRAGTGGGIAVIDSDFQDFNGSSTAVPATPLNPPNISLAGSIIAGNSADVSPDLTGAWITAFGNLIQNPTGATFYSQGVRGRPPITGISPKLGTLQDNGELTKTHALLPGSPAIDQIEPILFGSDTICGGNSDITTDQRGIARPQGKACDLGAYEYEYR